MFTHHPISHRSLSALALVLGVTLFLTMGCAAPAAPTAAPLRSAQPTPAPAQHTAAPVRSTSAPAPTQAPAATQVAGGDESTLSPNNTLPVDRKIIKNAQLALTVKDTATAIFQITGISSDVGGYVVGSRTFGDGDRTGAQISISVPVDRFEEALNMVRHTALHIDQDITSSAEVTEQFIDLESRLRNLEATATRLRDFLNRANTITETSTVNTELTRVEEEIETIKGKLNAMNARSSFSTIAVDLRKPLPTLAPTPSPTLTPSPTPVVWHPDETVQSAVGVQTGLFQGLVNVLIWFSVVLFPYLLVTLGAVILVRCVVQRTPKPAP